MSSDFFKIEKKGPGLSRAGKISTAHGDILTPAFIPVGTKATVKSLTPKEIKEDLLAQAVLANTYHLYLEPGDKIVRDFGGLGEFMGYSGPTFTDSGGFQAFSLGVAFGQKISKIAKIEDESNTDPETEREAPLAKIDEEGVNFKSYKDGSAHRFTPEISMDIQWNLGADMFFAFDECTSPAADYDYQKSAMDRTHRWALRSLNRVNELRKDSPSVPKEYPRFLFAVVQGGRHQDLREESAKTLGEMDFDGYGIGGSFDKEDIGSAVGWVNKILPEEKPRHLLGIGEPLDILDAILVGCDTFDCVSPTRKARNGRLYTRRGEINILNAEYKESHDRVDETCDCYVCKNFTRAYLAHLFRSKEILASTLASLHNLRFTIRLVEEAREAILNDTLEQFTADFKRDFSKS